MRKVGLLLCGALAGVTLMGVVQQDPATSTAAAAQAKVLGEHWRFHDGHWGYYYPADRRWYYTDGNHWFFEDSGAWRLYRFDREFGRGEHFVRGDYKVPAVNVKIKVPNHVVFRL